MEVTQTSTCSQMSIVWWSPIFRGKSLQINCLMKYLKIFFFIFNKSYYQQTLIVMRLSFSKLLIMLKTLH